MKSNSVVDTLAHRLSIRTYLEKPINDEMLEMILNSARRAPTSSNTQSYSLIVVRDIDKKRKLAEYAGNQSYVATCDTFVVVCADIFRLDAACEMHGVLIGKGLENSLVASVDASLVGMSLALVAESYGLGTVMIGGIRNHPKKVAELLEFPKGVYAVFGVCMGWPDPHRLNDRSQKPRMGERLIIHREKYSTDMVAENLSQYDAELAKHYRETDRMTPDAAWTGIIAKNFSQSRRPHLSGDLEDLGFVFH